MSTATVLLAAAVYVPSFLTKPGMIADDSKQYLYLDPGRLIQSAMSMWDPDVGMGTVTHQNIGFLFPMGPYYWIIQQLHIPMWVGQRFWMGSLFFFAGTGIFFLGRLLGLNSWGRVAAGVAYTFTPFVIDYIARISAIVMPWSALGWMVGLVILSVRRGGWRWPALFGLVIALVGGVNATSILLAGLAPALWLVHAVFVTKEVEPKRALAAVGRLGVFSVLVSLWWVAGLWAEGAYGLNILKYTETVPTVTSTSLSSEVIRGLGYWYFYGQDKLQPWTTAATEYMSTTWLVVVSFAVPAACVLVGAFARWRYRAFAIGLLFIGVVAAVAAYPFDDPSPLGRALRAAGSDSTIGLAMRSTNRVVPLIVLGFALLLGSGVSALAAVHLKAGLLVLVAAVALAVADLPPLWSGNLVATNLARPEQLPNYVTRAAAYLNTHGSGRVFGLPGEDFAYYRYGVAGDPVWPGLLTRPYVARQVVPQGEPASVDLLQAIDESIQDGVFVPSTLAPIARLMSAGDILFESDEQYERFNTARPQPLWLALTAPTTNLGTPVPFGTPQIYKSTTYPLQDETQLAIPTGASVPPPVAVFAVPGARSIVRTETTSTPLLVAGSGAGLVNAAAMGLLANNPTIFYSASFDHDTKGLDQLLNSGAVLVVTDTNQRQQDTYGTLDDNTGYVEQANVGPLGSNPAESSAGPVPGAGSSAQTVTTLSSVASIQATDYGNPITNTPEDRAYNAFDQNPDTRWAEGAFTAATGAVLKVALTKPVRASQIRLLQPQTGPRNRFVTRVTLTFDGRTSVTRTLSATSRREPGQVVHFPSVNFRTLAITIDATSAGHRATFDGLSGVGFADVTIPGVAPVVQTLRLPTDLLNKVGATSITHPLDILMNRIRSAPVPPRSDPELDMRRSFSLPTARTFMIGGIARISAQDPDPVIDQIVGRAGPVVAGEASATAGGPAVITFTNSSGRLPGDPGAGAYAAVDGNSTTSWMPGFGNPDGNWVQYGWNKPVTISGLDLQVVTDGRHSIPTKITITGDDGSRVVTLPSLPVGRGRTQGSTTATPITFAPLRTQQIKITVDATRPVRELDYYSDAKQIAPIGLAEIGIPGVVAASTPSTLPAQCLSNLLTIDGTPVDVEVSGSTATGLSGGGLTITGCGNSANGITLSPGSHVVQTAPYQFDGIDIDTLSLSSAAGGGPLPLTPAGLIPTPSLPSSVPARVLHQDRTHLTVSVTGTGTPYWLVLGESQSQGWKASVRGGPTLGSSTLIDGYANGWLITGSLASGTTVFTLTWTPQRVVDAAILVSGVTVAASVVGVVMPTPWLVGATDLTRRLARRVRRRSTGTAGEGEGVAVRGRWAWASGAAAVPLRLLARRWSRRNAAGDDLAGGADPRPLGHTRSALVVIRRAVRSPGRWVDRRSSAPIEGTTANDASLRTAGRGAGLAAAGQTVSRFVTAPPRVLARRRPVPAGAPLTIQEPSVLSPPLAAAPPSSTAVIDPSRPTLTSLFTTRGRRPGWLGVVAAAVLAGGLAGAVTAPIAAPIVFGAVILGCLVPWSRALFALAPVGLLVATGVYVAVRQHQQQIATNIEWPAQFPLANTLAWMAVAALVAAGAVEIARWRPWAIGAVAEEEAARAAKAEEKRAAAAAKAAVARAKAEAEAEAEAARAKAEAEAEATRAKAEAEAEAEAERAKAEAEAEAERAKAEAEEPVVEETVVGDEPPVTTPSPASTDTASELGPTEGTEIPGGGATPGEPDSPDAVNNDSDEAAAPDRAPAPTSPDGTAAQDAEGASATDAGSVDATTVAGPSDEHTGQAVEGEDHGDNAANGAADLQDPIEPPA